MSGVAIIHEAKMKFIRVVGGGLTYAASKEGAQKVLESAHTLDPAVVAQWAGVFAAAMTGLYFAGNFAYICWKWRREARSG